MPSFHLRFPSASGGAFSGGFTSQSENGRLVKVGVVHLVAWASPGDVRLSAPSCQEDQGADGARGDEAAHADEPHWWAIGG